MRTCINVLAGFGESAKVKSGVWLGLIIGACITAPTASQAGLYAMGNAYLELSINGGNTVYDSVLGYQGQTLATISPGQTLNIGGQIQTYTADYPVVTTMGYSLNGGSFQTLNLPISGGDGISYNQWDSGAVANIAGGLNPGNNTLTVYFYAYCSGNGQSASYNNFYNNFSFTITEVPEPIMLALPLFGGLVLTTGLARRFRSRRAEPVV